MKKSTRKKQVKQDRKKRKEMQKRREAQQTPELAYSGSKYRKEKYVPIYLAAETAILEAYVIGGRRMTDHGVRNAVTLLIMWLRRASVPALADLSPEQQEAFGAEEFLAWSILEHWKRDLDDEPPFGQEVLIGVLRTTLNSIDVWGSTSPTSRGYLEYLEGFLGQMGVTVQEATPEQVERLMAIQEPWR